MKIQRGNKLAVIMDEVQFSLPLVMPEGNPAWVDAAGNIDAAMVGQVVEYGSRARDRYEEVSGGHPWLRNVLLMMAESHARRKEGYKELLSALKDYTEQLNDDENCGGCAACLATSVNRFSVLSIMLIWQGDIPSMAILDRLADAEIAKWRPAREAMPSMIRGLLEQLAQGPLPGFQH